MKIWPRLPSVLMIVLTIAVGSVFLRGCAIDEGPVGRWMSSLTGTHGLPKEAVEDLARFREVYDQKSIENEDARDDQFKQFVDGFKVVRRHYVKEVSDKDLLTYAIDGLVAGDTKWLEEEDGTPKGKANPAKVVEVALDAMTKKLDPHSSYMTAEEFQELMVDTQGEFGGLGIEVQKTDDFLKVVSPIEGTPADKAGLKPNDHITHVEGVSIKDWTLMKIVRQLRGKPGTPITVTVERENEKPFDVTIVRDIIQVRAVRHALYDDYLHLRISSFSERLESDVRKAFDDARDQIGDGLKGVVLDLRNNPGGLLQQSVALSDIFLNDVDVVSIRGRGEDQVRNYGASDGDLAEGLPVVVLINGGSASASEIVSGALQDHNRAILMGRRTFGKGSVQTIMPLMREGAMRLTTSLYYLPSGRTIQQVGVAPDIRLDLPEKKEEEVTAKEGEEDGKANNAEHNFNASREADLPNVLSARILAKDNLHDKEGVLGNTSIDACPEIGIRKDKELGCAIEFLKAGSAKKFLAGVSLDGRG
ncbi:S41 family peptidase [Terasakiella sp. A23]|uniref:S41 family peptidase n=1 Tax=Terasakiella sp. FCG-A23 TaxID=3080561 RepID=UPI002952F796|nr:S41 family peptidase [Terasakiella sp. A23]MDV7339365.1 S41 family peptidase [Terasakiella sp. A23]